MKMLPWRSGRLSSFTIKQEVVVTSVYIVRSDSQPEHIYMPIPTHTDSVTDWKQEVIVRSQMLSDLHEIYSVVYT